MDATDETAPAEGALAAEPKRHRRRLSSSVRRVLLAVLGVLLLAGSVAGFYLTADAFDERIRVVVAAAPLSQGQVLSPGDLTAAEAHLGDIPYIEWTADAAAALSGFAVSDHIPAGGLVGPHMLVPASSEPIGDELEVVVPLDTALAPSGAFEGDLALLIDPGVTPSGDGPGRPRSVIRPLELRGFDGSSVRLFVPPEEWVWWRALPSALGATPMALPVPLGGDAADLTDRLDTLWAAEHAEATAALHPFGEDWLDEGAPGELEVLVPIDTSLAPSGVSRGDLVLLVDPGAAAGGGSAGRPRAVLRSVVLEHYEPGVLGIWAEPEEWAWWHALPVRLGAAPMVLRVASGTDVRDVAERLNEQWRSQWQQSQADGSAE
ncbi:SAF domain-containing protein [Candidatus Poriferisodalis sp.]|uniref:SAF domain-containing protein n=1 Tax=Candidatus Poriferisodalis sp. TaxID=3101277 RepID=UPI003B028CA0